jgi:hypothetical protein
MNIPEIREKIKRPGFYEPIAFVFIFILISLASFGLGRLSVQEQKTGDGGVTIIMPDGSIAEKQKLLPNMVTNTVVKETKSTHGEGAVFASKNGTTYYFESCGSSSRIKEENKVWFDTENRAQEAGYHLAKACE